MEACRLVEGKPMWIHDPARKNGIMHSDVLLHDKLGALPPHEWIEWPESLRDFETSRRMEDMLAPEEIEVSILRGNDNFHEFLNPFAPSEWGVRRVCTAQGWRAA
jgi:hypothetical protein